MQIDGGFEEADIYCNQIKQHIYMSGMEAANKAYKKYFWLDKEIKLLELISSDVAIKKS